MNDIFVRLAAPFPEKDIEWRAGATNSEKTKAMALAYITSRAVMDRLDEVVGPENWKDEYRTGPSGGVLCGISIAIRRATDDTVFGTEWVTKYDGAENTDFEPVKGGLSDAFKRAGYKWGIGRYLYDLPGVWVDCEVRGKSVVLKSTPKLPAWALPGAPEKSTTTGDNGKKEYSPEVLAAARNVVCTRADKTKGRLGDMSHEDIVALRAYYVKLLGKGPISPAQDQIYRACGVILGE